MINVVCLKWGDKYGPEYVNRLYGMIGRNTTRPFRLWCFTERTSGIRSEVITHPLPYASSFEGWWNKVWLFSNELPIPKGEQIFYVDLDTLIVGNIDQIMTADNQPIIVLRDLLHGIAKTATEVGSGLMNWRHGDYEHVWTKFLKDPQGAIRRAHPHGDQWWVQYCVPARQYWQDLFPGQVVSFKVHCIPKGPPPTARIICYHGKPGIPDSASQGGVIMTKRYDPQAWVLDHWRE